MSVRNVGSPANGGGMFPAKSEQDVYFETGFSGACTHAAEKLKSDYERRSPPASKPAILFKRRFGEMF
jgi:hypothetical protein